MKKLSKKMKNITCFLLVLFFLIPFCNAQKNLRSIFSNLHESSCALGNSGKTPNQCIVELVGLPRNPIDEMLKFAKSVEDDDVKTFVIISALGFLCSPDDNIAIKFIENKAYSNNINKQVAIESIFRIGGKPLDKFLQYLFLKDDFELQLKAIEYSWVIDELLDLKIIQKHVKHVLNENPRWKISGFISSDYSKKLDTALQILQNPDSPKSLQLLKDILAFKNPYFNNPGGNGLVWAVKMLTKISPPSEKENLQSYLIDKKNNNKIIQLQEAYLFYLFTLGDKLSSNDIAFLKKSGLLLMGMNFIVIRSAKELNEYYSFKKSII